MKNKQISDVAIILSLSAVVLSAIVSVFGVELWLAGTQWMLVGIVFAVWALYFKK